MAPSVNGLKIIFSHSMNKFVFIPCFDICLVVVTSIVSNDMKLSFAWVSSLPHVLYVIFLHCNLCHVFLHVTLSLI